MRRGDGRLSAVADPSDVGQDECGVFGVWAPAEEVAQLAYFGLYALQHRGTESAGIATSDGRSVIVYKDMGLVSQVFDDQLLRSLRGHLAVAHVRYATTGRSTWENAQPTLGPTATGTVALAHNGNLVNTVELMEQARSRFGEDLRGELGRGSSTDTAVITALLGGEDRVEHIEHPQMPTRHALLPAVRAVLPKLRGAFSLVFMDENTLYAARDEHGVRPLVLGRLERGWVVASETAALDIIGAAFVREVEPGEILAIDADGVHTERFAPANPKGCVFEYVYLARPDTLLAGRSIQVARERMGELLARDHHVEADLVISTPDSGTPAAIGYARASGIPYGMGLVKNAYVGRTFIQPTQMMRQRGIRLKLNPLRHVIEGKRLVVVDDSIVRGNTQRALVRMLREAGAREVHVRISSPPVTWPCFYGIDFATRAELISAGANVEEVCQSIGADSLGYLSLPAMVEASGQSAQSLCMACFDGNYPIPLEPHQLAAAASPPLAAAPVVLPPRRGARHGAGAQPALSNPAGGSRPSTSHEEKTHE